MSEEFKEVCIDKRVKVGSNIPLELHLVAKQIYAMQGTSINKRIEKLLKADLKRTMKRERFQELDESEVCLLKMLMNASLKK